MIHENSCESSHEWDTLSLTLHGLSSIRLGLQPFHPIAIVTWHTDPWGYALVTGAEYTTWLQSVAILVYHLTKKDTTIAKWGTHSLRVTAADLLHCAQYIDAVTPSKCISEIHSTLPPATPKPSPSTSRLPSSPSAGHLSHMKQS
jgi:hypothetical protein